MKGAVPEYLARALQRHPVLLADLLALHNRCSRSLRQGPRTLVALVLAAALGLLMVVAVAVNFGAWLASSLVWMAAHHPWVAAAVALYAAMQVARRRLLAEQRHALSWLISAPRAAPTLSSALLWRTLWPLGLQLALVGSCVLVIGLLHLTSAEVLLLMCWIVGGVAAGAVVGWWRGGARRAQAAERYQDSRYIGRARRHTLQDEPSTHALSGLPIARALAWHRPENTKVFLLVFMITLPLGTSAQTAACVAIVGLLMSYTGALARAVLQTASEAARWLQATPIRFLAFAWPIMRRAVAHQVVLSLIIALMLLPLGAEVAAVLYLALLWLTLVFMTWTIWLHGCFQSERALIKVVGSVAATLGMEQLARGWGIGCAALWTVWNLRTRTP